MSAETVESAQPGDEILAKVRHAMAELRLDALLPMSPENVAYTSGSAPPSQKTVRSRHAICVIPSSGETEIVAIKLEGGLVAAQSRLDRMTLYEEFVDDPIETAAVALRDRGLDTGRIGIEEKYLSVADQRTLAKALPHAALAPVDGLLAALRKVKTRAEIEALRDIGAAAERIARESMSLVEAGATERDLANVIAERYAEAGGDTLTMLVVASGPRSAHVNAPATDRVLAAGDVVRVDVIGTKNQYYSDVARTAVVGEPTAEQRRVYDLLMQVHERALDALRPGAVTSHVYQLYRDAMEDAGFPPYHFVGHGLGITLHEDPFVNELNSIALEPGMVLCIEPLTLLDGRFGMQIEDEVLITADGYEPLTRAGDLLRIAA